MKKIVVKKTTGARRSTATQWKAMELRGQVRSQVQLGNEGQGDSSAAGPVAATLKVPDMSTPEGRRKAAQKEQREANAARHAKFEKMVAQNSAQEASKSSPNPLLNLSEEQRAKLFMWLRECPYDDAVQHMLKDQGIADATQSQLTEFFQLEAENHWEKRIERAALEANALVQLVERSPVQFSSGILAALGQEAFRQIASGEVAPEAIGKITTLFLKARSDDRAEQMLALRREKLKHDWKTETEKVLEAFARELPQYPAALEAFEHLKNQLLDQTEHLEEVS